MANEISGVSPSGTLYARIKNSSGLWWNGTTFEVYSAAHYSLYVVTMTEEGNSGEYVANFPAGITSSGTYSYRVHRTTTTPAEGDLTVQTGTVDWTGSSSASTVSSGTTGADWPAYVQRMGFKRTDKDTEIYECTSDAIQEMRRRFMFDEAESEATTTDTISVSDDFKFAIESDLGLILGVVVEDDDTGEPLIHVPKSRFDELYPDINVNSSQNGFPKHFTIFANSVYIGPKPDSTDYVYRVSYSRRGGIVSASTTFIPFTDLYRDIICDLVLSRMWSLMEDFDKANYFRQRFEIAFEHAMRRERTNSGADFFIQKGFYL